MLRGHSCHSFSSLYHEMLYLSRDYKTRSSLALHPDSKNTLPEEYKHHRLEVKDLCALQIASFPQRLTFFEAEGIANRRRFILSTPHPNPCLVPFDDSPPRGWETRAQKAFMNKHTNERGGTYEVWRARPACSSAARPSCPACAPPSSSPSPLRRRRRRWPAAAARRWGVGRWFWGEQIPLPTIGVGGDKVHRERERMPPCGPPAHHRKKCGPCRSQEAQKIEPIEAISRKKRPIEHGPHAYLFFLLQRRAESPFYLIWFVSLNRKKGISSPPRQVFKSVQNDSHSCFEGGFG